jgi:hypothetical protein
MKPMKETELKQIEEMAWDLCDIPKHPDIKSCEQCGNKRCHAMYYAERAYNAGYRKQGENVIELPCKAGQTVYMPWEWEETSGIAILTVERISITKAVKSIMTDLCSDDEDYWLAYNCGVFYFDDIGKTVFLTKEEAEAKMKGGAG